MTEKPEMRKTSLWLEVKVVKHFEKQGYKISYLVRNLLRDKMEEELNADWGL